jgi:hypothetical protein
MRRLGDDAAMPRLLDHQFVQQAVTSWGARAAHGRADQRLPRQRDDIRHNIVKKLDVTRLQLRKFVGARLEARRDSRSRDEWWGACPISTRAPGSTIGPKPRRRPITHRCVRGQANAARSAVA